jgi:hypothetical protein
MEDENIARQVHRHTTDWLPKDFDKEYTRLQGDNQSDRR